MTSPSEWTDEQVALLRRSWGKVPTREIAEALGFTYGIVKYKAILLGLTRPEGCMVRTDDQDKMNRWRSELYG